MSLYTMEEICKGCRHAVFVFGKRREAFDYCDVDAEGLTSGVDRSCPKRDLRPERTPTDSEEGR